MQPSIPRTIAEIASRGHLKADGQNGGELNAASPIIRWNPGGYRKELPLGPKELENGSMRLFERIPLKKALVLFLLLTLAASLTARTRAAPARSAIDQEYIAALATANHFLQAWQSQDQEAGILLLSDKVKGHTDEEHLQSFFSLADNTQEAYEISGGKKLKEGRYIFPVALFNARNGSSMQRRSSRIIVMRVGKNDWAVDKLP